MDKNKYRCLLDIYRQIPASLDDPEKVSRLISESEELIASFRDASFLSSEELSLLELECSKARKHIHARLSCVDKELANEKTLRKIEAYHRS